MSSLFVYHTACPEMPQKVLNHEPDIAATLAEYGVTFARVQVAGPVTPGADTRTVLSALGAQIDTLKVAGSQTLTRVISVGNDHPQKAELRAQWLQEQSHDADEVRFFAMGRGLFSLHLDGYVFALLCERNDVVSVPAGTRHWFDPGEHPHLVVVQLFSSPDPAVQVTGDDIARRFAGLED